MKVNHRLFIACAVLVTPLFYNTEIMRYPKELHKVARQFTHVTHIEDLVNLSRQGDAFESTRYLVSVKDYSRDCSPEQVARMIEYIRENPDFSSYHLLLALKKMSWHNYQNLPTSTKAKVLCSAMAIAKCHWDWSLISESRDPEDFISSISLIELGVEAIPFILPLLDNPYSSVYNINSLWNTTGIRDIAHRCICSILEMPYSYKGVEEQDAEILCFKDYLLFLGYSAAQ